MRFVPFLLALALLGATAAGAGAAPTSPSKGASLCTVGKGVAAAIAKSGGAFTPSTTASPKALGLQMKATFTQIKAAEKVVLAAASGSIKGHLQKVFAFENVVFAKLKAANWNFLALAQNPVSVQALAAQAQKIQPDLRAIDKYFAKCK
jgi:hypothetical protein